MNCIDTVHSGSLIATSRQSGCEGCGCTHVVSHHSPSSGTFSCIVAAHLHASPIDISDFTLSLLVKCLRLAILSLEARASCSLLLSSWFVAITEVRG